MRKLLLLMVFATACNVLGDRNILTLSATATRSHAAVGDTIMFPVNANGTAITSLQIAFGDGASDQFLSGGNPTLGHEFRHAYSRTGTFHVTATAHDGSTSRSAEFDVVIDP